MKKIILLIGVIIMIIAAHFVMGQTTDGVITYEIRINLHRNLPPEREGQKAMIPEFRTYKQQLFFNPEASLYKPLIEEEDDEDDNSGGRRRFRFRQTMEIFCDQNSGRVTSTQDLFGKKYLIEDSVKVDPWKLGNDVKTIMGYECKQAFYTNYEKKQTITAWYTDQLRPFLGPERFNTLPGAVLAVDINNAERVLVATKVELRPLKKNELKEPTDGEKTTEAEFKKLRDERMKNMRGGNGTGTFIIRN